jgi:hypothetical protein
MRRVLGRIVGTVPGIRWLVLGIVVVAVVCAVLARLIAPDDFPTLGRATWWSVQTVTTIGYGDVTPTTVAGRVVASVLMVSAVALISVITAAISASFVSRIQARRGRAEEDQVLARLERIERQLERLSSRERI